MSQSPTGTPRYRPLVKTAIDENGEETGSAIAGEASTYRISASNNGPSDVIAPVTVEDTLPAGISFVGLTGGSSSNWSAEAEAIDETTGTQSVRFTLTPDGSGLAKGVTAPVIEFDVLVDASAEQDDTLINTATVDSGTPESDETNNTDTAPLEVNRELDVAIEKSHDPNAVCIGDELPFSLDVVNNGPSEATGITVTDDVPAGLDVLTEVGDLGEGWMIDEVSLNDDGSTTVVASYEHPIAPGESAPTLTITTLVTPVAYETVTNMATVSSNEPDRVPENNTTENPVVVPPMVELVVEKTAVGDFQVGETGTFEISLVNNGPTDDPGPITVTDVLPDGLTYHSSPDEGVEVDGNTVSWTLENGLPVGESVTLTLVVNVQQGAYPEVTNTVTVDSAAEKTPESVLADSATVNVGAADPLPVTGGDMAALAMLIALLLLLGGTAAVLHSRRKAALATATE